jgi:hypothetical protein
MTINNGGDAMAGVVPDEALGCVTHLTEAHHA